MKKIVIGIVVLSILVGAAGYWYWQKNPYSRDVLKLEILGPESVSAAKEVTYTVKYKNNGDIRLEEPRIIFEFPENTLLVDGTSRRIEIGPDQLDDIYPGEEKTFQFRGRLLGKEGDVKVAKVQISYQPKNLQARYESETTLSTVISSVPLTFDFDLSSKVQSGRDFDFALNYFSSLNYPLTDLSINIEYPNGFEFLSSKPSIFDKNQWDIPLLNRADGGRIKINGRLLGELGDHKIFRAVIGIWQNDEFIALKEISKGVEITKPQLSVFMQINGQTNYIANPGDILHYEIFFRNIGDDPFSNLFLVSSLDGSGFDYNTIKVFSGQFQNGDNSIVWDHRTVPKLKFLSRGQEGIVEFWVELKDDWPSGGILKNSILVGEIKEEFETKVNSNLMVSGRADYHDEVFGNSGPNPAEVGSETTYTIIWQVNNSLNDVSNVRVRTSLPANVKLVGKIFPESQSSKFAYDSSSREVIWIIGDAPKDEVQNIAFQVSLNPRQSQRGTNAVITSDIIITGEDQWTNNIINRSISGLKTSESIR